MAREPLTLAVKAGWFVVLLGVAQTAAVMGALVVLRFGQADVWWNLLLVLAGNLGIWQALIGGLLILMREPDATGPPPPPDH